MLEIRETGSKGENKGKVVTLYESPKGQNRPEFRQAQPPRRESARMEPPRREPIRREPPRRGPRYMEPPRQRGYHHEPPPPPRPPRPRRRTSLFQEFITSVFVFLLLLAVLHFVYGK